MQITIDGDANQVKIVNQCIDLMTNFKASNGLLFIKSADRTHIGFIFQPNSTTEDFDAEKRKAESEWCDHLLSMIKTEIRNVDYIVDEDSVLFSFNAKQEKKSRGKKRSA
jgi:hypothetical protein